MSRVGGDAAGSEGSDGESIVWGSGRSVGRVGGGIGESCGAGEREGEEVQSVGDAGGCVFADQLFPEGGATVLPGSWGESGSADEWDGRVDGDCGEVVEEDLSFGVQVQVARHAICRVDNPIKPNYL